MKRELPVNPLVFPPWNRSVSYTHLIEPYSDDQILSQMRRQAQLAIDSADVIILVVDIQSGVTANDQDVAVMLQKSGKPVVLAVNKACLLYTSCSTTGST